MEILRFNVSDGVLYRVIFVNTEVKLLQTFRNSNNFHQLEVPQIIITIFNFDFLKMKFSPFLILESYKNVNF